MIDWDYRFVMVRWQLWAFCTTFFLIGAACMFALYPVLMGSDRPRS